MIAELGRAVEELRAEVAELRRRVGRSSRNSSMPPASLTGPGGFRHGGSRTAAAAAGAESSRVRRVPR